MTKTGLTRTTHSNPARALSSRVQTEHRTDSTNPRASPSGHTGEGESICQDAIRETFEETGIVLDHAALRHVLSIHQRNPGTADARIGFAFTPREWDGEPVNAEPREHSEFIWADPVPARRHGRVHRVVITATELGVIFTLNGW